MQDTLHVVCPSCGGVNRVPPARIIEGGHCGKCKSTLFQGKSLTVDEQSFQRQLRRSDVPLLVDFWAPWCGPCKTMAPAFEQAAAQLEPRMRLLKLNTEQHQQSAGQLGIRNIPTLILFHHGKEVDRMSGAMNAIGIVNWASRHLI